MPKPQRIITFAGRTQTLREWARELGVNKHTLSGRIHRMGLDRAMRAAPPPFSRGVREAASTAGCDAVERGGEAMLCDVADALGVTRQRAGELEMQALTKVRFGLRIIKICGQEEAEPLLEAIRHQSLPSFYVAARAARRIALARLNPYNPYEAKEELAV